MKSTDIALILKREEIDNRVIYKPFKVEDGFYDKDSSCFITKNGEKYSYILEDSELYCYCNRLNIDDIKKEHKFLNTYLIKKIQLHFLKKLNYEFFDESKNKNNSPLVIISNGKNVDNTILVEEDGINFYRLHYPEFFLYLCEFLLSDEELELYKDAIYECVNTKPLPDSKESDDKVIINTKELYEELTSSIIAQDKPIKMILAALWKQRKGFSNDKSRNILINGGTGVGKTEIFRILTKILDIPCVVTGATEYSATGFVGKNVEDMLVALVLMANGDVKKAERGILIIDEIDKISESNPGHSQVNQKDVQDALLKILEDGVYNLNINKKVCTFDTSKLMVVGMGSWSRIDLTPEKVIGFEKKEEDKTYKDISRQDMVKNGLIRDLIGRFNVIIQMNDLDVDNLISILKTKKGILNLNKEFFSNQGVELDFSDDVLKYIAQKAIENGFGARGLDEVIEKALSLATFEISNNPELYSKLIVSKETIDDNTKYVLVKRK